MAKEKPLLTEYVKKRLPGSEAAEVSMCTKVIQFIACALLCSFFFYQVYEIYQNKDKWASNLYSTYGAFESWWNKQFKRTLMNEFAYTMPDQKELYPYKAKATLIFGYVCAFGSLLLLTGEKFAVLLLIWPQLIYSIIFHGPMYAKTQTAFGRAEQAWVLDFALIFALIMVTGS